MIYENIDEFILYVKTNKLLPIGTLRFYENWFGRPYDNHHESKEISYCNNQLIIKFMDTYEIAITNPTSIELQNKSFIVHNADSITYEYGKYGNPNENKVRFIRYDVVGEYVHKFQGMIGVNETQVDKFEKAHNAFEILSY